MPVDARSAPRSYVDPSTVSASRGKALKPAALMRWKGKGYWCVNLLEHSLEVYSTEDCEEDVTDAG